MSTTLYKISRTTVRPGCVSVLFRSQTTSTSRHIPFLPRTFCSRTKLDKTSCLQNTPSFAVQRLSSVPDPPDYDVNLSPVELKKILDQCNIIDVRQPEELIADGVIPGAVNIPLGELPAQIENIDGENVVFICRSGIRSLRAISFSMQYGFNQPRHLEGGMMAWNATFQNE